MLLGNIANKACALAAILLLTRILGPDQYGIYALGLSIVSIAADLSDLGLNASAVRYGAQFFSAGQIDRLRILYSILLRTRIGLGLLISIGGMLTSGWLARVVFEKPELTPYLRVAFLGPFGIMLNTVLMSFFESQQLFHKRAAFDFLGGFVQLIFVGVLGVTGHLTPVTGIVAFISAPLVVVLSTSLTTEARLVSIRLWDAEIARTVLHYGKWMALWGFAVIFQNRLDVLMLTRMASNSEVGIFHAASRIAMLASLVPAALAAVATPRLVASRYQSNLRAEAWKMGKLSAAIAGATLVVSTLAPWTAPWILGESFRPSGFVLMILLWGWALFAVNLPFGAMLNVIGRPQVMAVAAWLTLIQTFLLNLFLIPKFGANGAALSFAASLVTVVTLCVAAIIHYSKKGELDAYPTSKQ